MKAFSFPLKCEIWFETPIKGSDVTSEADDFAHRVGT